MKKLMLIIVFMLMFKVGKEHPLPIKTIKTTNSYAQFIPAYNRIRKYEGYYSNHKKDKGKETYGGVTRKFNKEWYGWNHINKTKRELGKIPWNHKIELAEIWVLDYYLDVWVKEKFYEIRNQKVANYIFDFRINVRGSIRATQKVLVKLNQKLKVTGILDDDTIKAINNIKPNILLIVLRDKRISIYRNIVKKNKSQKVFLEGWLERANQIK